MKSRQQIVAVLAFCIDLFDKFHIRACSCVYDTGYPEFDKEGAELPLHILRTMRRNPDLQWMAFSLALTLPGPARGVTATPAQSLGPTL